MLPLDKNNEVSHSIVVFGASGYLATRVIFPTLWELYRTNQLPPATRFYGFTRKKIHPVFYKVKVMLGIEWDKENEKRKCTNFWNLFRLQHGDYSRLEDYAALGKKMSLDESKHNMTTANRLFYLAVPPIVFDAITLNTSRKLFSPTGWNRIVVEKPFARNDTSYRLFQTQLCQTFKEHQIYMIDHFLGKDSIMNLLAFRFANIIFSNTWNNQNIECVMITSKSMTGVGRRAPYFDSHGIIRDVMQNHIMQMLSFVAMEQPYSFDIEHIRDERLNVLRNVIPVNMTDVVLGQYVNNMVDTDVCKKSYIDEKDINPHSLTPTFALVVVHIENKRWKGVPFILRCGMAMNECKSEIRVQYKKLPCNFYGNKECKNELVICIHPQQDIFLRMLVKMPSEKLLDIDTHQKRMTDKGFKHHIRSENYIRLWHDVFQGNQLMFMRSDEVCESWRIFSPVLTRIDLEKIAPLPYPYGSRGPRAAIKKAESYGFRFLTLDRPSV